MRTTTEITSISDVTTAKQVAVNETHFLSNAQVSYHEMADQPVREIDPIEQLQNNLALLGDLQKRMSFLMREVRYQLKM